MFFNKELRSSRFEGRERIGVERLRVEFFGDLEVTADCLGEALQTLEYFYEIPIELLRPEDTLDMLFDGPPVRSLKTLADSFLASEFESDIEDLIERRMKTFGTWNSWRLVFKREFESFTIREFVLAYCGKLPQRIHRQS